MGIAILNNFGGKYGAKLCKRIGRYKGDIPTVGEEMVPKLHVDCEGGSWGGGGTPVEHTYQQKNMYICELPFVGVVPVRYLNWIGGLGVTVSGEPACPAALCPDVG